MKIIFLTLVTLYALYVAIYFLRISPESKKKQTILGKGGSIGETERLKVDIVGKSRFDLHQLKPPASKAEPPIASSPKTENPQENPDIFAPSNPVKSPAEIPPEQLDVVFSNTPNVEKNELMEIEYPLDYEEEDETDPEEEEEVEGTATAMLASGVRFEELGSALQVVTQVDGATTEQKQKAGDTFLEIRKTDLFEQVVLGKPDAKRIVTELMAESLAAFFQRKDQQAGTTGNSKRAPDDFNIRDFA